MRKVSGAIHNKEILLSLLGESIILFLFFRQGQWSKYEDWYEWHRLICLFCRGKNESKLCAQLVLGVNRTSMYYNIDWTCFCGIILEQTTQLISNCFQRKTLSNLEITDIIFRQSKYGVLENL